MPAQSRTDLAPVSCYIRTKNEELNIERTVRAALQACQEVVIVDSGSTDKTIELARAAGAKIVHQRWLGNGLQKRAGEEACSHDWVLDLDADEELSQELQEEIRNLFSKGTPKHTAYELILITVPPVGKPWYKIVVGYKLKLYNRMLHRMPESAAWDQLELPKGVEFATLKGIVWHYSFRDLEHMSEKMNAVSTRRAKTTKKVGVWSMRTRLLFGMPFYFLQAYILRGRWRAGLYGFSVARIIAHGRWLRDAKRYEAWLLERRAIEHPANSHKVNG